MKIKLVLARIGYNPEITWTVIKSVDLELPLVKIDDWEVIGA